MGTVGQPVTVSRSRHLACAIWIVDAGTQLHSIDCYSGEIDGHLDATCCDFPVL